MAYKVLFKEKGDAHYVYNHIKNYCRNPCTSPNVTDVKIKGSNLILKKEALLSPLEQLLNKHGRGIKNEIEKV